MPFGAGQDAPPTMGVDAASAPIRLMNQATTIAPIRLMNPRYIGTGPDSSGFS